MGLLKNLRLLFDDNLLGRMTALENRQDLLEEYTSQKLDSMKVYSARVLKRERDEQAAARTNDHRRSIPDMPPGVSEAARKAYERRTRRQGNLALV